MPESGYFDVMMEAEGLVWSCVNLSLRCLNADLTWTVDNILFVPAVIWVEDRSVLDCCVRILYIPCKWLILSVNSDYLADLIFMIYLYQRWVYPVDKKRINEFGFGGEDDQASGSTDVTTTTSNEEGKKTNWELCFCFCFCFVFYQLV